MRNKNKFKGNYTIVDTSYGQFDYDSYVEYCEDMDMTPASDNSEEFFEWCSEETDANYEADMCNIKHCAAYNKQVRLNGYLGLWDGKHKIEEYIFDSVYDAIKKCISERGDITIKATWENGIIYVYVSHHDGTNCFNITPYDRRTKFEYLYNIGVA